MTGQGQAGWASHSDSTLTPTWSLTSFELLSESSPQTPCHLSIFKNSQHLKLGDSTHKKLDFHLLLKKMGPLATLGPNSQEQRGTVP